MLKANDKHFDTLRKELVYLIESQLSPLALKYGYSDVPLESKVKWKPMVLVLGNYSSGKSTLINELLQANVQETGQAPTDDCFTVLTYAEGEEDEREGNVLLNDPQYPFEMLKKHGDKFASHFRLKKVKSEILKTICIIDTPGMLDAVAEKERGYDYQKAIGDLAVLSDLVLMLFDPHKAGTIRETHASLRDTLPQNIADDRVIFVLNRIDECSNFEDLLRVYGTLTWNLSHMTGRKDIPRILLTYSAALAKPNDSAQGFLHLLENQRQALKKAVYATPRYRLDHLVSFLEFHSKRLGHLLEGVQVFAKKSRSFKWKWSFWGVLFALICGSVFGFYNHYVKPFGAISEEWLMVLSGGVTLLVYLVWQMLIIRSTYAIYRSSLLASLDSLTPLDNQGRVDTWLSIRELLNHYLQSSAVNRSSLSSIRKELESMKVLQGRTSQEMRKAIHEVHLNFE